MIRPLSISTDGYINKTKRVLSIAVNGYLSYEETTPPIPPIPTPITTTIGGGGSYARYTDTKFRIDSVNKRYGKKNYYNNSEPTKIEKDDEDFLFIIKTFLKCQD